MSPLFNIIRKALAQIPARLRRPRRGQTIVEYSLVLALIAVVCIAAFSLLGRELISIFSVITTMLDTAQNSH